MPSRRTNKFPESGRGLGHVTPTIFGSTVGYPSDSLASCLFLHEHLSIHHQLLSDRPISDSFRCSYDGISGFNKDEGYTCMVI